MSYKSNNFFRRKVHYGNHSDHINTSSTVQNSTTACFLAPGVSMRCAILLVMTMLLITCSSASSQKIKMYDPMKHEENHLSTLPSPSGENSRHHHHHHQRHSRRHYRHSPDDNSQGRDTVLHSFTALDPNLVRTSQNHSSATIQRLIVDPDTGMVYVGASNFLYQLTPLLSVVYNITNGPQLDNPYCPPPHSTCECLISGCKEERPKSTDSIVRTMVIDYKDGKLIVCYNIFKGHCRKYLLGNISVSETPRYTMMVPSDENSSVVMFIAPGPPNPASTDVLYIATTRSNKGLMAYKDSVPTICTRNIQDFEFVSTDILVPSKIDVEIQQREIFKVHYVHGFSSLGFSYFLSLQKTSVKNVTMERLVSRISRICHGDKTLYSYTEIPFECWVADPLPSGSDSSDADDDEFDSNSRRRDYSSHSQRQRSLTNYNVLLTASVIKPGSLLAKRLGLSDVLPMSELEDVLVGVFGAQDPHNASSSSASSGVNGNLNDNIGANQGNHDSGGVGPAVGLPGSAICIYPMRDVRRIFTETIQSCFEGIGNIGPDHFVQPIPCKTAKFEITDEYCGEYDVNHPIIGSNPITSTAAILLDGVKVTSLAATTANDETVLFVGTDVGDVRKLKITSDKEATEYERISINPGIPLGRDMSFDPQQKHLYAFINRTVYRMAVEKCATYETCEGCIGAGDPYCGWCSLQKRCTAKDECSDSNLSLRWLSSGSCARIVKVVSNQAQKISNSTSLVMMTVQNPPVSVSGLYFCSFSGHGVTRQTQANISTDPRNHNNDRYGSNVTLKCDTPRSNLLPPFPTGKDHILMTLSLTSDDLDHLSTNFTFFDCSVHNSCTKCTTSSYPCTWCTQSNRCTGNKEDCLADTLITGVKVPGNSDTPGPAYCPRIENIQVNTSEILIPSGSELALKVKVIHHQPFQFPLRCSFSFNGGHEVDAHLIERDVIECSPINFDYSSSTHFRNVPFGITWGDGGRKNLDNPTNLQVRIYKCQEMASNCGRCRAVDYRLSCGWCRQLQSEEGRCTTRSSCLGVHDVWMLHSLPCRDAYLLDIYPRKGPMEGGTLLTVKGENLGLIPQDTEVHIGGLNCKVTHYDPSIEFTCVTSNSTELLSSPLTITVGHNVTFTSDIQFSYVKSGLTSMKPLLGPKSGGSILTLSGHNLDSGSNVTVELSSSSTPFTSTSCVVVERSSDWLKCKTMTSDLTYTADLVEVTIDRSHLGLNSRELAGIFTFVDDPIITFVDNKKSIMSGGNLVTVRGERLNIITNPKMVVYRDEDTFTSPCTSMSDVEMICLFPKVTSSRGVPMIFGHRHHHHNLKNFDSNSPAKISDPRNQHLRKIRDLTDDDQQQQQQQAQTTDYELIKVKDKSIHKMRDHKNRPPATVDPLIFHYGFIMDGVKSLLNFSDTFQVYPDPEVELFEDGSKKGYSNKLEHFTINGHHLNLALSKDDYRVTIGDEECEVTSLSLSYLMCSMKHIYNMPSSAEVKVFVGNTTVHRLGTLERDGWPKSPLTSTPFLVGIGVTALLLIVVVVTICWCYRVKTKRNTRVMRRLKNQMDILESRVAKECKEAFAELQTDMTEVTQDFMGKIPFRDYRGFCANVLFPGISLDHPVFRWGTGTGLPPNPLPTTPTSQYQQLLLQQHHQNLQQQLDTSYSTCSSLDPAGAESCLLVFSPTNTGLNGKGLFSRSGVLRDHVPVDSSGKGAKVSNKMVSESTTNTLNNSSTSFISSICFSRESLKEIENLLLNRSFLLTLIRTLELRKDFIVREKVNFASLLSVALQPFMDYHTDILKTLLSDLIERAMEKQNHPKLLLRRTESVAEKMLTNWFAFLLYKFLKDSAGEKMFMLFRAVKQQVEKGPVDQLTSEARYSLSEEKLIRQQVDFKIMTLLVPDPESGNQHPMYHQVKVLDCDTVSQAKEKILDVVFRHSGFSTRPCKDDLDIEWINPSTSQSLILQDEDESNETSGEYKRLNTLNHYHLPDQSLVSLVNKQNLYYNHNQKFENFSGSLPSSYSLSHNIQLVNQSSIKTCHLVKNNEQDNHRDDRGSKMVSEVYLTRLLATKGTLQTFVDDLFRTIFSCDSSTPSTNLQASSSLLPLAIKYMFDFFDDQATHHGICDPEVVHTWKSNSLPLRFWVNIVKNPDFVFDIHKSNIVDACLSVIGQTFMDSCCMSDHKLSKDSPSSKLLYAKDIPKYKSWVIKYYEDIKQMPSLSEHEMMEVLKQESQLHQNEFNTEEALREISRYIFKYYDDFKQALLEDEFCSRDKLSDRLDVIHKRTTTAP